VWIRAAGSTAAYEAYAQVNVSIVGQDACTSLSSSASPGGTVAVGTDVTINSTANCGRSTPTYRVLHLPPGGSYAEVQAYGTTGAYVWNTATAAVGVHRFEVWLRGQGSTAAYEAYATVFVTVIDPSPYFKASNTGANDIFGYSVSISADGTRLAVAAPWEDSSATGIGGNQADNSAVDSGAVYVFARTGTTWTQEAYIKASNTGAGDSFGYSVSLSGDGTRLVVGSIFEDSSATGVGGAQADNSAADSGAAYVFLRTGTIWTQEAYIKASNTDTNDVFGAAVSISADGTRLVAGAQYEGSSATGIGGNEADNSIVKGGAAYVFARTGTTWVQEAYVKASNTEANDDFGASVSLSADGTRLAVSAIFEGSSATGINGTQADNSALQSGAVFVFSRSGTTWTQDAYVKASNAGAGDRFGRSVSLSGDGTYLAVGAWQEDSSATGINGDETSNASGQSGAAYVFSLATWTQEAYVKASNTGMIDYFGQSVSLSADGSRLAVGAHWEDSNATGIGGDQLNDLATDSGAVYEFSRTGSTWTQADYVKASAAGASDRFGQSVSMSSDGSLLAVGAHEEDSSSTGIGGNQADNSSLSAGAVYVY
jgi:hypothetical protein